MKPLNFILTGVGGQGILLSSDILCLVGMTAGYDVKKTDVHGMAQRGGSVISHVRLADRVFSPMVPVGAADYLLSFEKLEACRWLHYLRPGGVVVVNDEAIPTLAMESRTPYPDDEAIIDLSALTGQRGPPGARRQPGDRTGQSPRRERHPAGHPLPLRGCARRGLAARHRGARAAQVP